MAEAIANCYVLQRIAIYSWQIQLAKKAIENYIYTESVSWQVDTPAAPASQTQNLHGTYLTGDNPQTAARGDRLLFAGAFATTPYFNIGHKKRCASNTPQTSIFNLLRR